MSGVSHGGKSHNYSEGGIYFETDFPFSPGTIIHIRREKYSTGKPATTQKIYEGFRSVTLAEVTWCKLMSFHNGSRCNYRLGAKYFRTD